MRRVLPAISPRRALSQGRQLMRAVVSNGTGGVRVEERPIPVPSPGEELIKVSAVGVNRADVLQAKGKYPPPPGITDVLGLEVSGTLPSGERVAALLAGGGYAEYATVPKSAILKLPTAITTDLTLVELAAIPEAFLAAHHILFQKGELSENKTVLINAAASGVGISAIQLAKTVPGVRVLASASTQTKLKFCKHLGADHVINYTKESIYEAATLATTGSGVDLVLDCVGAQQFKENERSLKQDGRWVMYGLLSGPKGPDLGLAGIVMKRLTVLGTTLRGRPIEERGALVQEFSNRFATSFGANGPLRPIIHKVFHQLSSCQEALNYLESNANIGKLVIEL